MAPDFFDATTRAHSCIEGGTLDQPPGCNTDERRALSRAPMTPETAAHHNIFLITKWFARTVAVSMSPSTKPAAGKPGCVCEAITYHRFTTGVA